MRKSGSFYTTAKREPVSGLSVFIYGGTDSAAVSWELRANSALIMVNSYLLAHLY